MKVWTVCFDSNQSLKRRSDSWMLRCPLLNLYLAPTENWRRLRSVRSARPWLEPVIEEALGLMHVATPPAGCVISLDGELSEPEYGVGNSPWLEPAAAEAFELV